MVLLLVCGVACVAVMVRVLVVVVVVVVVVVLNHAFRVHHCDIQRIWQETVSTRESTQVYACGVYVWCALCSVLCLVCDVLCAVYGVCVPRVEKTGDNLQKK